MNANALVDFAHGSSTVVDIGDIYAGAWTNSDLDARTAVTTYGLAGAPSGKAVAALTATDLLNVDHNVRLEATDGITPFGTTVPISGTVTLAAGQSSRGIAQANVLNTNVDLYNNTAIPISTTPDAQSNLTTTSLTTIAASDADPGNVFKYGVNAAGNITVAADRGAATTNAAGVGTDIYLEALSKVASAVSNAFGGGDVSFKITGGSSRQDGTSTLLINGLIDTGIQRTKTLTVNYATSDTATCSVATAACLAAPTPGEIGYTLGAPELVGANILNRLQTLIDLKTQYASDAIAVGAYQGEISFLEAKLVAIGLATGSDSSFALNPGVTLGNGSSDTAQNLLTLSSARATFADGVITSIYDNQNVLLGSVIGDWNGIGETQPYTVTTNVGNFKTALTAFTGYAATLPVSSVFRNELTDLDTQLNAGNTAISAAGAIIHGNQATQVDIATQVKNFDGAIVTLSQPGGSAATTTTMVAAAIAAINNDLNTIAANNVPLEGKFLAVKTAGDAIKNDTSQLVTGASTLDAQSHNKDQARIDALNLVNTTNPTLSGALAQIAGAVADIKVQYSGGAASTQPLLQQTGLLQLDQNFLADKAYLQAPASTGGTNTPQVLPALASGASRTGLTINSLLQWGTLLTSDATVVANGGGSAAGSTVTTTPIIVADTVARLGNIYLTGSVVRTDGTGTVSAPGDATIAITNNTGNGLQINNLTIAADNAGRVRVNGALIASSADITALNRGHVDAGFAADHVVTSANSAAPSITITSTYNPESATRPQGTPYLATHTFVGPDITLNLNKAIDNLSGAATILSDAGNIYLDGAINAASVSVTARNGDLVTGYVNGFDHVGGDPASQVPTLVAGVANQSGLGTGITANGSIFLAARYLNINSTVQSGIVDWHLAIADDTVLTSVDPMLIGVSQSRIDAELTNYKFEPPGAKVPLVKLGGGVTLDLGRATPTLEFSRATADAYVAGTGLTSAVYAILPDVGVAPQIGAGYDAVAKQFVIDGTNVHGGKIQLYGQIINTSPTTGTLNVLDGFGTIAIENTTSIPVVLSTLSTGADPLGTLRGTEGRIEITDVHLDSAAHPTSPHPATVDATYTVYTRSYDPTVPGSGVVDVAQQTGRIDPVTGQFVAGTFDSGRNFTPGVTLSDSHGGNRTASYSPLINQRYVWTTGDDYAATTDFSHNEERVFGSSALSFDATTSLDISSQVQTNHARLDNGTYVTTATTQADTGPAVVGINTQGIVFSTSAMTTPNASIEGTPLVVSQNAYATSTNVTQTGSESHCHWYTACITSSVTDYYELKQQYTVITTNSLKADQPIAVNFIGSDTGSIGVTSASRLSLTGDIKSLGGKVALTTTGANAGITQADPSVVLTAHTIDLESAGTIGTIASRFDPAATDTPIRVALTSVAGIAGGALTANAAAGVVNIASAGALTLDGVTATGDVLKGLGQIRLLAANDITAVAGSVVQADRVDLTSQSGAIGGGTALLVNTGFTTDQKLRFGDPAAPLTTPYFGLSAHAGGSINLRAAAWSDNATGTILASEIVSTGGNVTLKTSGQVLDNNPVEAIDTRNTSQLLAYWNTLGLVAGSANDAKKTATIAAFDQSQTQLYRQYWQIRGSQPNGGSSFDPTFMVSYTPGTPRYLALYAQYSSDIRATNPGITAADLATQTITAITGQAAAQTSSYRSLDATVGQFTATYAAAFAFQASPDQIASLTRGATWSKSALGFSLSAGVLKTITDTSTIIKAPNVAGRVVTIDADLGIGETLSVSDGHGGTTRGIIVLPTKHPENLSDAQKVALAAAERSDLVLTIGGVRLPPNPSAAQLAAYQAAVALGIDHGTTDIPLGAAPQDLTARQSAALDAAALDLTNSFSATHLTILAKRPVNFAASEALNAIVAAPAGATPDIGSAFLSSRGDGLLGSIDAQGETRIKVAGDLANTATGSSIRTGDLILEAASGAIGANTPLVVDPRDGATLTARALNGVELAVHGSGQGIANVDTIYSPNAVKIEATGSIVNANRDTAINILGATLHLTSDRGSIGDVADPLNVGVLPGGAIVAAASKGSIDLFGPQGYVFDFAGVLAGGNLALTGVGDIALRGPIVATGGATIDAGGRIVIGATGQILTTTGDVSLAAASLKMLDGAHIDAKLGTVDVTTTGDALVTALTSGAGNPGAITVTSGGHILAASDPARAFDLAAAAGGIVLRSGLGIGDETEADTLAGASAAAADPANTVTPVADALRLTTGRIDVAATAGAVDLTLASTIIAATVHADNGSVTITAARDYTGSLIEADHGNVVLVGGGTITLAAAAAVGDPNGPDGTVMLSARRGDLALGSVASTGTQTLDASGGIRFTALTSTGLGSDPGDIDALATNGKIAGGSVAANGGVRLTASDTVSGQTIVARTGSVDLVGPASIIWTTINAGTAVTATAAGGSVLLGQVTSGGSQSLAAQGAITVGDLAAQADVTATADTGDLTLRTIAAAGSVDLTATAGSIAQTGHGVAITAEALTLTAGGDVGSTMTPLNIMLRAGDLDGTVGRTATLASPGAVTVGAFTAANGVAMSFGGDLRVQTLLASANGPVVAASARFIADAGAVVDAGGRIAISATGDVIIGAVRSRSNDTAVPVVAITSDAGSIRANGDGAVNLADASAGVGATLDAGVGIGPLQLDIANLRAVAGTGSIDLAAVSDLHATLLSAVRGAVTITGTRDLSLDTLLASSAGGIGGITATAGGWLAIGTATSFGNQSLGAAGRLSLMQLTAIAGDIAATSTAADLIGGSVIASGSVALIAATDISGIDLTATAGAAALHAGGRIDWQTATVGTQYAATSTAGPITLGTVTSGGTQTITAAGDVRFGTLTTGGLPTDAGDVTITSATGAIVGGTIAAHGSAALTAATGITGDALTTATGSARLTAAGPVDWQTATVGTHYAATSTAGPITLGTVTSGGTQTITAAGDVRFGTLTTGGLPTRALPNAIADAGDVVITAGGAVAGQTVVAAGGVHESGLALTFGTIDAGLDTRLTAGTVIIGDRLTTLGAAVLDAGTLLRIDSIDAAALDLRTAGAIELGTVIAGRVADFAALTTRIGTLRQNPRFAGPLVVSFTGSRGIGRSATAFIDAPNGLRFTSLLEDDASFATTATAVRIDQGTITATLRLVTPLASFWMNNLSPRPVLGYDVQLFQPTKSFELTADRYALHTNSYVVQFGYRAQIYDQLDYLYLGVSFVRDIDRLHRVGDDSLFDELADPGDDANRFVPTDYYARHLNRPAAPAITRKGDVLPVNTTATSAAAEPGDVAAPIRVKARESVAWNGN